MIKIKGLKDFGTWLRKGEEVVTSNQSGFWVINKGYAEFIGYADDPKDKRAVGKKEMEMRVKLFEKYGLKMKNNYSFIAVWNLIKQLESKKIKIEKKVIHILLSEKSWNELRDLDIRLFGTSERVSYSEYLKQEEIKPTMALFG